MERLLRAITLVWTICVSVLAQAPTVRLERVQWDISWLTISEPANTIFGYEYSTNFHDWYPGVIFSTNTLKQTNWQVRVPVWMQSKQLFYRSRQYEPIVIVTQPQDVIASPGTSVTFSIKATGFPLDYQWRGPAGKYISGATNATLTLKNLKLEDFGFYSVSLFSAEYLKASRQAELRLDPVIYIAPTELTNRTIAILFAAGPTNFPPTGSALLALHSSFGNKYDLSFQNPPSWSGNYAYARTGTNSGTLRLERRSSAPLGPNLDMALTFSMTNRGSAVVSSTNAPGTQLAQFVLVD